MDQTINDVFARQAKRYGNRLAIEKKTNGQWHQATWAQYYERARETGLGLTHLGIRKGDRVSLLSENRLEWLYTDMGTLGVGGIVVTIYPSLTAGEIAYIVDNSGSKVLVLEDADQLAKAREAWPQCPTLEHIVVMVPSEPNERETGVISFTDLMAAGRERLGENPDLFEQLADDVKPDDMATLVYTSGTTGVPKGAMITHHNIMAVIESLDQIRPPYASDADSTVPFLPLSHVFERAAGHYYGMYKGITASYAETINTLLQDFKEKRPTMILAVPRVCEKVYQKICLQVEAQPRWRQKIFHWGHAIGLAISDLREKKAPIPLLMKWQYRLAYRLIFSKLQQALGGRVRWMTASGAPTSRDIILFFNAAGITVVEGYGMTECFAPATMSNLSDYRIGTVGKPLPGVSIKLAEDGEILVKGDNVFKGYWKMEEETRRAFTEDGYFMSGDIGQFDADGFLSITDRKKNIIITSGGKNIAPQKIEGLFLSDPLFAQFIVIGERRKFLAALLTINLDVASHLANENNIPFTAPVDLLTAPAFLALVEARVQARNGLLARFETIKKYRIVQREFSQEMGELTPSLKLKRNVVLENFQSLVEEMYAE